ncbi:hypothetical protein AUJ14_02640 [Candidatus Micrarchaeota archaeon CG1_02_55_22]|nr:MAG: hypothetical protein AUJ14_02640 [Candidatus Micrarchaeota archaeon CG1_02_55_22]
MDSINGSILCSGSIALDTTRTPQKTVERVLGGAASYFGFSASFFTKVGAVTAVGGDFPQEYWDLLAKRIDLDGVQRVEGAKTFFYDSSFDSQGNRTTNATELNILGDYDPVIPARLSNPHLLYLATMPPEKQESVLAQTTCQLSFLDTISYYIANDGEALKHVMGLVDGVLLNDEEAAELTGESGVKAGKALQEMGPKIVVVKHGALGCTLFFDDKAYPFPAFPVENALDASGAGDCFAGGMMGVLTALKATRENVDASVLREAVAVGSVMGSFAVEGFSLDRLVKLKDEDIRERLKEYKTLLRV